MSILDHYPERCRRILDLAADGLHQDDFDREMSDHEEVHRDWTPEEIASGKAVGACHAELRRREPYSCSFMSDDAPILPSVLGVFGGSVTDGIYLAQLMVSEGLLRTSVGHNYKVTYWSMV